MFSDRTNWNLTTNRLSEALARHRARGRPLLDLSASNPTECEFRYDIHAIMRALCSPAALEYRPDPKGLVVARQAVADGVVPAISPRSVRRILQEVDLQPHRTRYWKTACLDEQFKKRAEQAPQED